MRLILLFILVPFLELFLLLKIAELTSAVFTFALVVLTGVIGATLARHQGWKAITRLREELNRGQIPTAHAVDALMIFVAGALLITPGVLTDLVGFSLLIPACRRAYRSVVVRWLRHHVGVMVEGRMPGQRSPEDVETIDARVVARDEDDADP
jgi:UPF0716 protein FxsA